MLTYFELTLNSLLMSSLALDKVFASINNNTWQLNTATRKQNVDYMNFLRNFINQVLYLAINLSSSSGFSESGLFLINSESYWSHWKLAADHIYIRFNCKCIHWNHYYSFCRIQSHCHCRLWQITPMIMNSTNSTVVRAVGRLSQVKWTRRLGYERRRIDRHLIGCILSRYACINITGINSRCYWVTRWNGGGSWTSWKCS